LFNCWTLFTNNSSNRIARNKNSNKNILHKKCFFPSIFFLPKWIIIRLSVCIIHYFLYIKKFETKRKIGSLKITVRSRG
jgi:GT2 family glycosyltransferase